MSGKESVRKISWLFVVLLALGAGELWAQKRIYATVEPNRDATDQKLVFDTNLEQTDNISPNIVLSKDGTRGFVAYPGSGVVAVFSLQDGAVLNRIQTGGKPAFATPLPDNHSLLVTSVLDNRVFLIDMDQASLIATYTFPGAQFGFGSIVTVSADGRTGYVSSTGSAEVIKFSIADGKEIGRAKDFQGPAQITLSLDGAILLVVDTLAEEVVLIDSATLTRKSRFVARDRSLLANFTIFNKAVLSPDGNTAIIASRDLNGPIDPDTAFVLKTTTGELLDTETIGTEPGFTGLTPDGQFWAIFNEFSISLIPTLDPKSQREISVLRGDSLGSANLVFSPDSRYVYFASSSSNTVYQQDITNNTVVEQLLVGGDPLNVLEQPSSLAISPDGKKLAVLDFISNNVTLLTDVTAAAGTSYVSSADKFTSITLINLSKQTSKVVLTALTNVGQPVSDTGVTNPAEFDLPPDNQITLPLDQIFNFSNTTVNEDGSETSKETAGWLKVTSDQPEFAGYISIGDRSLGRVDGYPLLTKPISEWIVPETVREEGKTVELDFLNPFFNQGTYDINRIDVTGQSIDTTTGTAIFGTTQTKQLYGDLFPTPEVATNGYLRIKASQGLYFSELFGDDSTLAALNGIDVSAFSGVNAVYSPLFAVTPLFQTRLNVINASNDAADVTITLHQSNGAVIGQPFTKTFAAGEQLKDDITNIFSDPPVANAVGWIEIQSTQDRILGTVSITSPDDAFLATFQLSGTPSSKFLFPALAQDDQFQTGIALLNSNPAPVTVTLQVWGVGGTLDRSTTFTLAAGSQTAVYLDSYFPDLDPSLAGNLRIRSDKPLHALAFVNDRNLTFLSAVPALPLP